RLTEIDSGLSAGRYSNDRIAPLMGLIHARPLRQTKEVGGWLMSLPRTSRRSWTARTTVAIGIEADIQRTAFPNQIYEYAAWASPVLEPITEPNHAALQHLGAGQCHREDRRCDAGILVAGVEDARRALRSIDGGADRQADLVDQAGPQKGPVRAAAAFEQQA